ncbi:hypothetical protein F4806DRAFT_78436 [Annulohypoxylon nitens]|nr:hypothetical protein F4806DRAFT_78436 [Annulohypoxylon nitens]
MHASIRPLLFFLYSPTPLSPQPLPPKSHPICKVVHDRRRRSEKMGLSTAHEVTNRLGFVLMGSMISATSWYTVVLGSTA